MAKPDGYIEAADGGWVVTLTELIDNAYIPFDITNYVQHDAWAAVSGRRMRAAMHWQITVPDETTLTIYDGTWTASTSEDDETGADAGIWENIFGSGVGMTPQTGPGTKLSPYASGYDNDTEPSHAPQNWYLTTSADDCEVLGFAVETNFTLAYADSTPAGAGYVEHCGRTTGADTWRPYDKDEPASAWLGKRVISQSLNRLLFSSKQMWSVPL